MKNTIAVILFSFCLFVQFNISIASGDTIVADFSKKVYIDEQDVSLTVLLDRISGIGSVNIIKKGIVTDKKISVTIENKNG